MQFCITSRSSKFFSIPSANETFHQMFSREKNKTITITNEYPPAKLNKWKQQHYQYQFGQVILEQ